MPLNLPPAQADIIVPMPEVTGMQFRIRQTTAIVRFRGTTEALQVPTVFLVAYSAIFNDSEFFVICFIFD